MGGGEKKETNCSDALKDLEGEKKIPHDQSFIYTVHTKMKNGVLFNIRICALIIWG